MQALLLPFWLFEVSVRVEYSAAVGTAREKCASAAALSAWNLIRSSGPRRFCFNHPMPCNGTLRGEVVGTAFVLQLPAL